MASSGSIALAAVCFAFACGQLLLLLVILTRLVRKSRTKMTRKFGYSFLLVLIFSLACGHAYLIVDSSATLFGEGADERDEMGCKLGAAFIFLHFDATVAAVSAKLVVLRLRLNRAQMEGHERFLWNSTARWLTLCWLAGCAGCCIALLALDDPPDCATSRKTNSSAGAPATDGASSEAAK